jgi:DNA-binding response OmpR family regulator
VIHRGDGGEAIAAIELYRPVLVICDVQLPSLGGIGILKAVRSSRKSPPAMIMMTAYGDHETVETLRNLGALECLIKPASYDDLLAAVARHMPKEDGASEPADVAPPPSSAAPRREGGDGPVVLVVEDESELADEMTELLDSFGHRALSSGGVEDALQKLRAHPSLTGVLVDLGLAGESGLTLIQRAAEDAELLARGLRFLVLSGRTPDAGELDGLPIKPVGCLTKPARIADILDFASMVSSQG